MKQGIMERKKIWYDPHGTPLDISDMDEDHILNCIIHLTGRKMAIQETKENNPKLGSNTLEKLDGYIKRTENDIESFDFELMCRGLKG